MIEKSENLAPEKAFKANTYVVCHFDEGSTLLKLASETVFTFALKKS